MNALLNLILTPLNYPFMVRGLLAALMVGVVCATVGTYVVLRGMAFFGDALAHAILPGVAVGYLVGGGRANHFSGGAWRLRLLARLESARSRKGPKYAKIRPSELCSPACLPWVLP